MWGCEAFAGGPQGFSYLYLQGANATPTTLVTLDASGAVLSPQSLGDPPGRMLLDRVTRAEGTFLLATASNTPTPVADTTTWLQEFDAQGQAPSSGHYGTRSSLPVVVRDSSARCASAACSRGSSAWMRTSSLPCATAPRTAPARSSSSARVAV